MGIIFSLGAAMTTYSLGRMTYDKYFNTPKHKFKKVLIASFATNKFQDIKIVELEETDYGYKAVIVLPSGVSLEAFLTKLDCIEQDTYSSIRSQHIRGRHVLLEFGRKSLDNMIHYEAAPKDGLKIPLATHFGWKYLDFQDDASCHMLGGGATRMGKTVFLIAVATHIYTQSEGKARIVISSPKDSDYYMFKRLPNVSVVPTENTLSLLKEVTGEMRARKAIIDQLGNVNDAKTLKKRYPDKAFEPIFILIDEYGVFAESKDVQKEVIEIAERAGYLDIHLIIFAQRPDAKDVLKPRIKSNLLTKMAFTTASVNDSNIAIGIPDAAYLGAKKGRAILIDGMSDTVQVPYLSNEAAEKLLQTYYITERIVDDDQEGQNDIETPIPLPSFITNTLRKDDLSECEPPICHDQPNHEKAQSGWFLLADTSA